MKSHSYHPRTYRNPVSNKDEAHFQVVVEESDLWVTVTKDHAQDLPQRIAEQTRLYRNQIKNWAQIMPEFLTSFSPVSVPQHAPDIVLEMAQAAQSCRVGPMAAVAGAIAQKIVEYFSNEYTDLLVENGGDSYLHSSRQRIIGLLPDPANAVHLGVLVEAEESPVSFCSSSGSFGHSISFGKGELVVTRAQNGAFADAAATYLCNMLRTAQDIPAIIIEAEILQNQGLQGIFIQCHGRIGIWGKMELTAISS